MIKISIITLFPDMVKPYFSESMMWKAQKDKHLELELVDLRQFGIGSRRTVDDTPYGGGDGMLLKPEPVVEAIEATRTDDSEVILLCPQGKIFDQATAQQLSDSKHLIFVCGRYEGFDERIRKYVDTQMSVGKFVLTGGELPAMTITDAVVRLIPGVLGGEKSAQDESFSDGDNLEYPQYTRPEIFRGESVPEVLLSGNHAAINHWRQQMSKDRDAQTQK